MPYKTNGASFHHLQSYINIAQNPTSNEARANKLYFYMLLC